MGGGTWDSGAWANTRSSYTKTARPTVDHIYTSRHMDPGLDPRTITLRESRDSDANPNSTAMIVGLDVTGSMGHILDYMARDGLGTLMKEIYEKRPISDPHMLLMGIGDFQTDQAPLQVTQFEAENAKLIPQMEKIYLERNGGSNNSEGYAGAWWFAAQRTSIDCFEKRGKKGYLITVGDEEPTPALYRHDMERILGPGQWSDMTGQDLFDMASATYDIFHVVVEQGNYARSRGPENVRRAWAELMGQRVIMLSDHTKLAESIVAAVMVNEGIDHDTVAAAWSGDTSVVVRNAVKDLAQSGGSTAVNLKY